MSASPTADPATAAEGATDTRATGGDRLAVEVRDRVAYVWLDRPERLNGVDLAMLDELVSLPRRLAADRTIRAVVLQGRGDSFCSGLDFASVGRDRRGVVRRFATPPWSRGNTFQRSCLAWRDLPVPVVAVLRGHCYGAGLQLALAADFRIAAPDARLSVLEAKWGLVPDMSGTVTLRELVGGDVAKRLAMTGEVVDGVRAAEIGLVSEVADDPLVAAESLVAQLLDRSPDALAATKRLLHGTRVAPLRTALRLERRLQLGLMRGANHAIARRAGLKRETPRFVDRVR